MRGGEKRGGERRGGQESASGKARGKRGAEARGRRKPWGMVAQKWITVKVMVLKI